MGGLDFSSPDLFVLNSVLVMAPVIFAEKDFSRIFNDIHKYGNVFLDRIRERQWYELVYDNTDLDTYLPRIS